MRFSLSIAAALILASCRMSPADQKEFDKHCSKPGGKCDISATITPDKSGVIEWSTTTKDTRDPNSGSDKALFGGDDDDGGGTTTETETDITVEDPGTETTGDGETTTNDWAFGSRTTESTPDKGESFLSKLGNDIGKGFSHLAGEITGSNRKKRKKAREAQRVLEDAKDVLKQADGYSAAIDLEAGEIGSLSRSLSTSQAPFANDVFEPQLRRMIDSYNQRKERVINDTLDPDIEPEEVKFEGLPEGRVESQKMAQGRQYVRYASQDVEKFSGQADYPARKALVKAAEGAMDAASESYNEGNLAEGNAYYELGMTAADIALSVTPVVGLGKDIYECATGRSLLTGKKLTNFEKSMAAVGVMTLGLGKIGAFSKVDRKSVV